MERSGQVVATGVSASRPSARLLAVVIIGTIVLAGCHACSLPNSQSSSDSTACYSTRPSMFCDEGPPLAPFVYTAARPVPADEQGLATEREFEAVLAGWRQIEIGNAAALPAYQKGLARLLAQANRQGRLDPRGRLTIVTTQGVRVVPISYYGFAWKPSDFSQVLPATGFNDRDLEHYYHTPGVGMSLVAVRQAGCDETYFQQRQFFPVTAILRQSQDHAVLEFYNPLAFDSRPVGTATWPLDRDLTASIICMKQEAPRRYIEGFFDPGDTDMKPKLVLMEPYQPGKIPVVFVHGLGSSPQTWDDVVNRLRAQGDIYRQFQFWYFQYPTGGDLLESAASLREKLLVAREAFDPLHRDAARAADGARRAQLGRLGGPTPGQLFVRHFLAARGAAAAGGGPRGCRRKRAVTGQLLFRSLATGETCRVHGHSAPRLERGPATGRPRLLEAGPLFRRGRGQISRPDGRQS